MSNAISRRQFLGYSIASGVLTLSSSSLVSATSHAQERNSETNRWTPLLDIHPNNEITFYYPSPEMGQGVDTSLAMLFVEQMGGDINLVTVEPMPYEIQRGADDQIEPVAVPQFSGGSTSISRNFSLLQNAGALTRQLLLQAAAKKLKTPIGRLGVESSFVVSEDGERLSFGQLTSLAAKEKLPENFEAELIERKDWSVVGRARDSLQALKIVKGEPLYTMDMDYPGAKTALIARSPYLDGDVVSVNADAALKLKGVHQVVTLKRPALDQDYTYLAAGVAVIADDFWTAKKARDALIIEWDKGPHTKESTESLDAQCDSLLATSGQIVRDDGGATKAYAQSTTKLTRRYRIPTVSHAQLEPQNCIAHVQVDRCVIVGPLQSPGGASVMASKLTGLDRLAINIKYARLGGGFGRRLSNDHVAEAVTISQLAGVPVKLIWTREDDLSHDFYRPMGHHELSAGLDQDGNLVSWQHRLAGRPKHYRRGRKPEEIFDADLYVDDFPANLVANLRLEYFAAESGLPQGSWRAPAHTANAFVVQSFVDELAEQAQQDPLEFRLKLLGEPRELSYEQHGGPIFDTGRLANTLRQAAKAAKWGRTLPAGHGLGIAAHFTFGGYCAQVAEVTYSQQSGLRVLKVWAAVDVGTVVNPNGVIAQIEGGINDGLSTAMGQEILVEGGQVMTQNFDTYPMLRIGESVPEIEVIIIDSTAEPSGVGEMGIPPTAPAIANAIRAAGGPRLYGQPFKKYL